VGGPVSPPYTPAHRRRGFLADLLPLFRRGGQPLGARATRVDAEAHVEEHGGRHGRGSHDRGGSRGAAAMGFPIVALVGVLRRGRRLLGDGERAMPVQERDERPLS
jgi:hypothetical protein